MRSHPQTTTFVHHTHYQENGDVNQRLRRPSVLFTIKRVVQHAVARTAYGSRSRQPFAYICMTCMCGIQNYCGTYFVFSGADDYSRRSRIWHLRRQRSCVSRSGTVVQRGVDNDVERGVVAASRDHARLFREHRRDGDAGDIVVIRGVEGWQVLPRRGVPGLDVDARTPLARRHLQYCT